MAHLLSFIKSLWVSYRQQLAATFPEALWSQVAQICPSPIILMEHRREKKTGAAYQLVHKPHLTHRSGKLKPTVPI